MMTTKLFKNGRSQAVRMTKQCRFYEEEVNVNKIGDIVMLIPKDSKWQGLLASLDLFTEDYMEQRVQGVAEERKKL